MKRILRWWELFDMPYLQEVYELKYKITYSLIDNQDIVTTLDNHVTDPSSLVGTNIFPFLYIPSSEDVSNKVARTYICFDIFIPSIVNRSVKNSELHFYIFSHKNIMLMDNGYTRVDYIQSKIDEMFNGSTKFGIDKMNLKRSLPLTIDEVHSGKELVYDIETINQNGKDLDDYSR